MSIYINGINILNNLPNPNLLVGTKDYSGEWLQASKIWSHEFDGTYHGFKVLKQMQSWGGLGSYIYVEAGKAYTFSAYIKSTASSWVSFYYSMNGNNENGYTPSATTTPNGSLRIMATDWKRISQTFTVKTSGYIHPRVEKSVEDGVLYIAGMKLEEGSRDTDWCPNVNDFASASELESLKKTVEELKSRIGGGN
ncbi:hypothetical protein J2Z60_000184 [Lactobacillus colini]|uniref:CBM-cenC domain-containing protein n=1 Tax=Lactobacillus colini TaxID=1819254 RepID=A0ABS4MBH0_9LACO|nr:carbohydrate binding domain-containing protein [Lactobacillus colini]MBP2057022.1 hypothetical protein [Lactobacillus colini]